MYKTLIYCLLACSFNLLNAQNLNFESVVVEEDSSVPIADAIVAIEGTALAVNTDSNGRFVFREGIPYGDHVVTVTKEDYITKYFLIQSIEGTRISVDEIRVKVTKDEASRRKKEAKNVAKADFKRLKEAKRAKEAKEKALAKQRRKLQKKNTITVDYDTIAPTQKLTGNSNSDPLIFTETQNKYAGILGVPVEYLTNRELYNFIDDWMGVTYLMGGENKEGIDCSSFTQRVYTKAYDLYLERTAFKQYESKYTDRFTGKEFLKEGDLIFFRGVGTTNSNEITHVGIFLHNNKFVHSTGSRGSDGIRGVKISDLGEEYWNTRFVSGGRRINND